MGFATEKVNLISSNIYNKGDKKWFIFMNKNLSRISIFKLINLLIIILLLIFFS